MNKRRTMVLATGLLSVAMAANAVTRTQTIRIRILDSETRSVSLDKSGVPKNCDGLNYDAYCNSSQSVQVTNTLLAQEGNGTPFRISCSVDSRWSRCATLESGESFDARIEKHGIVVYYEDERGKPRKQLYAFVPASQADPKVGSYAVPPQPTSAAEAVTDSLPGKGLQEAARCSFSSVPAGAEIAVDGHYVGSTPSVLPLSSGAHNVTISMPGFAHWKRELTVMPGADLSVNAVLEKTE